VGLYPELPQDKIDAASVSKNIDKILNFMTQGKNSRLPKSENNEQEKKDAYQSRISKRYRLLNCY